MQYVALVPLRDSDVGKKFYEPLVRWLEAHAVKTLVLINGPDRGDSVGLFLNRFGYLKHVTPAVAGESYNPYTARNLGLFALFGSGISTVDYAVLLDADVVPEDNYVEELERLLSGSSGDLLIAGRTLTKIPDESTYHFNRLRAANFECYDGFTPPDHTVGSNMIIGKKVWEELGRMRDTEVSGGDGIYSIEWKKRGKEVTVGDKLIVKKTIYGMDFKGIVEKQFRRACCYPPEMVPGFEAVRHELQHSCGHLMWLLLDGDETFKANYAAFIDRIFKLGMQLGQLRHHVDKAE